MKSFRCIGEKCGGFIGADADTKARFHLFWACICVKITMEEIPKELDLYVGGLRYLVVIVEDQITRIIPDRRREVDKMEAATPNPRKKLSYPSNFNSKSLGLTEKNKGHVPQYKGKEKVWANGASNILGQNYTHYFQGPKNKKQKKRNNYKKIWKAVGPGFDPYQNRSSPYSHINYFDPLSVEIEAAETRTREQSPMVFACDSESEADDEAETPRPLIPRALALNEFKSVSCSELDLSSCDALFLPWHDENHIGSTHISTPNVINTSRWAKTVMFKA
ncbi:uncharacterized protein LOC132036909 [Lycium ferocissimum]|uniref:uncharacterized protein LOC132036909 n=1 Tax=Lycium ferocissimum TaxID=112874 RepID=UPI002815DD3D|nr:uncharacterized protein LOC132036909 [Lycium ferocissimum]